MAAKPKITKEMLIGEVADKYPMALAPLIEVGFHCIGCAISPYESLEQGALIHGIPPEEIDNLVAKMNKIADETEEQIKKAQEKGKIKPVFGKDEKGKGKK